GSIDSGGAVNVLANGDYTGTTLAQGGAAGGTAVAPALALTISDNDTFALLNAAAVVNAAGDMLVRAYHRGRPSSTAKGRAAGTNTAVGASLALTLGLDDVNSSVAGNSS